MSKEVDTRVVQMKFDNRQFEKNVQETLTSLEKLDESLQFKDAAKGFEKISQSAKEVNLSGMSKAVDTVKVKFSALEIAAISAINNITNKAINAGERLVKSLSVDNIAAGWQKFEDTTTSVGTLISQGFSMDEVEEQLRRLNWFTDETSYNFTDMVNNISKFTATGQSLTDSVTAMEGIATWAALSGANAQKASQAMYQLAQAMGKGALKYDDYKSIQNVNMDTREFRQIALDAAVAAGTLKKNLDGTYTTLKKHTFDINSFGNYLSTDAWLTSNVMVKAFNKYSSAVNDLYEKIESDEDINTASDAIAKYGKELDKFGLKAFKAAQEARTWTDVVSSVKDAVSSKWKETFEIIFGNYEEAKKLFTGLANMLYEVFAEGGNTRNEILRTWKELGGRAKLLDGIAAIFFAIKNAIDAVREAFREIFPKKTAQDLLTLTEGFQKFAYKLMLNEQQLQNLKDTFKGFFSIIKVVRDTILGIIKALIPGASSIKSITSLILHLTGTIGRVLIAFSEWINKSQILSTVLNILSTVLKAIASAIYVVVAVLYTAGKALVNFVKSIAKSKFAQKLLLALGEAFIFLVNAVQAAYRGVVNFITILSDPVLVEQSNSPVIKTIAALINIFKGLIGIIANAVSGVISFVKSLSGLSITEILSSIWKKITDIAKTINEKLFGGSLIDKIKQLKEGFTNLFHSIDTGKLIAGAFTVSMLGVSLTLARLLHTTSVLFGNASSFLKIIKKLILQTYVKTSGIMEIAKAFAVLAGSMFLLSKADPNNLRQATASMAIIVGSLMVAYGTITAFSAILSKIKFFKGKNSKDSVGDFGKAMLGLATAILAVAASLRLVQDINITWGLIGKLAIIMTAMTTMATIGVAVTRLSVIGEKKRTTLTPILAILTLSLSLKKMVDAIAALSVIPIQEAKKSIDILIPFLFAFGVFAAGAGQIRLSTVLGLFALIKLINYIIPELNNMVDGIEEFTKHSQVEAAMERVITTAKTLMKSVTFMAILAGIIVLFAVRGKEIGKATRGISMLFITMAAFAALMVYMTKQNWSVSEEVYSIFIAIGVFILAIEALSFLTAESKMLRFSASMILITGAVALLALVVKMIKNLNITWQDTIPLIIIGAIIATLEGLSALTGKAKILPLIVLFAGLYSLLSIMIAMTMIPFKQLIGACAGMFAILLGLTAVLVAVSKLSEHANHRKFSTMAIGLVDTVVDTLSKLAILYVLVKSIKTISEVLSALSNIEWYKFIAPVASITIILIALTKITEKIAKLEINPATLLSKLAILGTLVASMAGIALALAPLANHDWLSIASSALAIIGIIAILGIIVPILGTFNGVAVTGLFILAAGIALVGLALVAYNWIFNEFVKTLTKLKDAAKENSIGTIVSQIDKAARDLSSKSTTGVYTKFFTIGKYMVEGLHDGVIQNLSKNEGLGKAIAKQVIDETESYAIINSPSKRMYFDGTYIVEGFHNGISDRMNILNPLGKQIVQIVEEPVAKASEKSKELASRLVTDLQTIQSKEAELAKQSSYVLAEFSENQTDIISSNAKTQKETIKQTEKNFKEHTTKISKASNLVKEKVVEDTLSSEGTVVAATATTSQIVTGTVSETTTGAVGIVESGMEVLDAVIENHTSWWQELIYGVKAGFATVFGDSTYKNQIKELEKQRQQEAEEWAKLNPDLVKDAPNKKDYILLKWQGYNGLINGQYNKRISELEKLQKEIDNARWFQGDKSLAELLRERDNAPVKEALNKLKQMVSDTYSVAKDKVSDFLAGFGIDLSSPTESFGSMLEKIKDLFGISDDLGSEINSIFGEGGSIPGAFSYTDDALGKTKSAFEELYDTISNQMDIFSEFNNSTEISADQMLSNMESQIFGITEWSNNLAKLAMRGLDQGLIKQLGDMGPQSYEKVAAFVAMSDEQIQRANYLYSTSMKLPGYAAEEVSQSYKYAGELAVKGFSNALDKYKGIMNTYEIGQTSIEDIRQAVIYETPMLVTQMTSTGKQAAAGLSKGMEDETKKPNTGVIAKVHLLMNAVTKEARLCLDEHSPSKVFEEIGRFAIQGMSLGVDGEQTNLVNTMADVITASIDSAVSLLDDTDNMSPVLTPILDLSQIQNGAGKIDSMFGTKQVGIAANGFNANVESARQAQQQYSTAKLLENAINKNSEMIVEAIANSDTPVNVNLTLQGDSAQLFKLIRQENSKFTKINGYNALAY